MMSNVSNMKYLLYLILRTKMSRQNYMNLNVKDKEEENLIYS